MIPAETGPAPGTTLNDYRVRGFMPEGTGGTSTSALVMASLLVVAVLAVDAYVFFGPPRNAESSPAPAAVTQPHGPRAQASVPPAKGAAPMPGATSASGTMANVAPAPATTPVGTPPSLARADETPSAPAPKAKSRQTSSKSSAATTPAQPAPASPPSEPVAAASSEPSSGSN